MGAREQIIERYMELVIDRKTAHIPVSLLCREAGVSRKAFYYHFRDRFEVIEQIFIADIERPLIRALRYDYSHREVIRVMFENLLLNREFYKIAIMETTQNSLFETIVARLTALSAQHDRDQERAGLGQRERDYIHYRFAVEITYMIRRWMMEGMKDSPEFMSRIIVFPKE